MKRLFSLACISMLLTGCALGPTFEQDSRLDPVRPFTNETSEASKLLANFDGAGLNKTAISCVIDKALWEDEVEYDKGGFDPHGVFRATLGEGSSLDLIKQYGTVPGILRDRVKPSSNPNAPGIGSIAMNTLALNPNWTTLGNAGLGLGFGLLFTFASTPDTAEDKKRKREHLEIYALDDTWFMFPLSKQYAIGSEACRSESADTCTMFSDEDEARKQAKDDARQFAMGTFTQAAVNLGFKLVGKPQQTTYENGVKAVYQMLENETLGCPKVVEGTFSFKNCRVTFRENDSTEISPDFTRAAILVTPRQHVGLAVPCISDVAKVATLKNQLIQELVKILPKSMAYFASEEINGKWTPQKVVDYRGDHYFVVPVKRDVAKSDK